MTTSAKSKIPPMSETVTAAYARYPADAQEALICVRTLIFEEAERLNVGPIEETLKWGEPAYLTSASKAGSTIRLAWKKYAPAYGNLFLNCQTNLVSEVQSHFPDAFTYTGRRGLAFKLTDTFPEFPVRAAVSLALTYHRAGPKQAL